MEDYRPPASSEEITASFAVPTTIVNRFLVTTYQNGVRIAFAESLDQGQPVFYRSSVFLGLGEADELRNILEILLQPFAGQIAAMRGQADGNKPTE